jgi:hypothetical protein
VNPDDYQVVTSRRGKHPIAGGVPLVMHRGIDFDVEEKPPSWWHWKICPKIEASPPVVGNMKFQTRAAAIDACIVEIDSGLDQGAAR